MPDDKNNTGSVNNNHQVVLMNDVRADIKELAAELRAGNKEISAHLSSMSERMTKLEVQQQRIEMLDKEFKEHVNVMNPIRDEVLGIKKLGRVAITASGCIPIAASVILGLWHPWADDTRTQLAPVIKSLTDLQDKQRSDMSEIQSALQDQNYKITTLQAAQPSPAISGRTKR